MEFSSNPIYVKLIADSALMAMLADNVPFANPKGVAAKKNSIYPAGQARSSSNRPFITIQGGVANQLGRRYSDETFYIRVYNDVDKSYVAINQIASRVKELLHLQDLDLGDMQHVETIYESSLAEATDQALELNFRELHFRTGMI
jgi:hypothetical protein